MNFPAAAGRGNPEGSRVQAKGRANPPGEPGCRIRMKALAAEGLAEGDGGVEFGKGGPGEGDAEFAGEVEHFARRGFAVGDEDAAGADDMGGAQDVVGDQGSQQQGMVEVDHEDVAHQVGGNHVLDIGGAAGVVAPEDLSGEGLEQEV